MTENANCRRHGYLLGGGTLIVLVAAYRAHAPWPAFAVLAILGLGGALALVRGVTRPAT